MQTILPPSGNTIKILGKARSAEHGLRWMIRNAHITLTCSLAFPLGFFHFPFTLKQCADMPLAVFKVFLLDHIASPRRCIIGIIPTAVVNVKHGVSLSGREQNVAALIITVNCDIHTA